MVEDDPPENWKNSDYDDGLPRPWLDEPDFFEGEQWNLLGTFVEWMPVIGVVFAVRTLHGHVFEIAEFFRIVQKACSNWYSALPKKAGADCVICEARIASA